MVVDSHARSAEASRIIQARLPICAAMSYSVRSSLATSAPRPLARARGAAETAKGADGRNAGSPGTNVHSDIRGDVRTGAGGTLLQVELHATAPSAVVGPAVGTFVAVRRYFPHDETGSCEEDVMTDPEVLQDGPTRPGRRPVVVAVVAVAAVVALLAVWTAQSRPVPTPVPTPTPSKGPATPTATPHPLDPGPILIQTAVPELRLFGNGIFELYRNHQLLDSGQFQSSAPNLDYYFEGTHGEIVLEGDHLVKHEPLVDVNWTWRRGTGDYAGLAGSGTAEFIAPDRKRYGILGRLSGTVRSGSSASPSPSKR
jgi:hypothetical protein